MEEEAYRMYDECLVRLAKRNGGVIDDSVLDECEWILRCIEEYDDNEGILECIRRGW